MVTCTLTQHLVHMTFREMSDELLFVLSPPRFGSSPQRKNLKISVRGPAEKALITAWEQRNSLHLPLDMKSFYVVCDGLTLTNGDKEILSINPLNMLQRIGLLRDEDESKNSNAFFNIDMLGESEAIEDDQLKGDTGSAPVLCLHSKIYELAKYKNGQICFVYTNKGSSIWYLNRAIEWHFIASNFSSFFRLLFKMSEPTSQI